ncbi:serine hydrolase [Rhodanobacter sp. B04]|uniref:serine hydrolase domain-containing protein n=1 Tax=Rhodanobacter sp. B04 TaxID=1945860 RepID=UPI000984D79F|nr:serine hydrolase [Rhodanobacter sp. B04]OOG64765.1 serine hydrolase [Rhodanobacter sp. B04]
MKTIARVVLSILSALLLAVSIFYLWRRPDRAIRVATANVAQTLCVGVFVDGLAPERVFAESIAPLKGMRILLPRLHHDIDRAGRKVTAQWLGHFASTVTYYPAYGCALPLLAPDAATLRAAQEMATPATAPDAPVTSEDPAIVNALGRAFAEPADGPRRNVHAIVVMHDGRIIAERYADGFDPDTPQLGYSVSKSVVNALFGILVQQGRLSMDMPAAVPGWQSPGDPRHRITLDQLSRMVSGLALAEDDSGFDPVSTMLFLKKDMAAYAAHASPRIPPGQQWEYTSGNTLILAGILRDTIGGGAPGLIRFAHRELFDPLGMRHVLMEFDGAQTLVGSTRIYASARDWARFGQLYLDDGMAGGRRILPEGWSAYVSRQTLHSIYGSGFWTNTGTSSDGSHIIAGMPGDAYFASGLNGQRIVIVPSKRLVIVRLGSTVDPPNFDMRGLVHLVNDVAATVH